MLSLAITLPLGLAAPSMSVPIEASAVTQANRAPVAQNSTENWLVSQFRADRLYAVDADGNPLTYRFVGSNVPTWLILEPDGTIYGTPPQAGQYQVSFVANDGIVDSNPATLTINVKVEPRLVVNTLSDVTDPNDNLNTLREAVAFANNQSDPSTITFDPAVFAAPRKTITLSGTQLNIRSSLTITGPPAGLTLDANQLSNHFVILEYSSMLSNLNLINGRGSNGGSIRVTVDGNLELNNCTLSGNSATSRGGALEVAGKATINNSTISGNSAPSGGGIFSSTVLVINSSTIAGNSSTGNGGGILCNGDDFRAPTVRLNNSIVAGNSAGKGIPDLAGIVYSGDYNLVQANGGATLPGTHNIKGVDAKLAPLADNGGPTPTRALLAGSPAIDRGSSDFSTDQRGVARPLGSADDIGAYETQASQPKVTVTSPFGGQVISAPTWSSISGTAEDKVGVAQVQFKLFRTRSGVKTYWNGNSFGKEPVQLNAPLASLGSTKTTWSYSIPWQLTAALDSGAYTIYAYATNTSGITTPAFGRNFTISLPDVTKPTVTVTNPSGGQVIKADSWGDIIGYAKDYILIKQVQLKLFRTRNGVRTYWNGSSFGKEPVLLTAELVYPGRSETWWYYPIYDNLKEAADEGTYTIYAYATNAAGYTCPAYARNFTITKTEAQSVAPLSAPSSPSAPSS